MVMSFKGMEFGTSLRIPDIDKAIVSARSKISSIRTVSTASERFSVFRQQQHLVAARNLPYSQSAVIGNRCDKLAVWTGDTASHPLAMSLESPYKLAR
jgi:hypothetical protein